METLRKTAIETIMRLMDANNLSQAKLAKLAHIEKGHLNRVLKGKKPLAEDTANRLANYFKIPADNLYLGDLPAKKMPPTINDAILLLSSYKSAAPDMQALALALLTGSSDPLIDPRVRRAFEALKKVLEQEP